MPVTIGRTFLIWLVGVLVLTLILVSGIVLRHERRVLEAEHLASTRLLARVLAVTVSEAEAPELLPVAAMADIRVLELTDAAGRLVWRYGPSPDEAMALDDSLLVVREPLPGSDKGALTVLASRSRLRRHIAASALRLIGGLSAAMLLSLLVGLVLVSRVAGPLRRLATAVREFHPAAATGLSSEPVSSAEVADLGRAFVDMTQRLAAQEAEKMQAVATLAGGVAHDFNNLLAGILLHARWLERDPGARDEAVPAIRALAEEGAEVVSELLLFARRESAPAQELDLAHLVADQGGVLRHLVPDTVGLEVVVADTPVPVLGSPVALRRLLLNLVVNARDAVAPVGGTITVTVAREREQGLLEVSDNGPGIPSSVRDRMFEPFFSSRREGRGAGLGLAVVYAVVHEHGGTIGVDSEPGLGTRVRVRLPLAGLGEGWDAAPKATARTAPRVLLVEADSRTAARLVEEMAVRGLEVRHVLDAAAAREAATAWPPTVVVAELDGEAAGELAALSAIGRPLLVVAPQPSAAADAAPGVLRLEPPLEPARVLEAIERLLDSPADAG
jgi:signal transduction histidine kinase